MADGRNRAGPPEDSSSSRVTAPNYPVARRRNMTICITAVVIVLGIFMTAGTTTHARSTRARIYEPHRVSWAELREDLHRRKAFGRALRMSLGSFVKLAHRPPPPLETNNRFGSGYLLKYLHTQMCLVDESQVLLCTSTCFVFFGTTFGGQLLVLELSQRWVGTVPNLQ